MTRAAGRILVTPRSLTAAPHPALGALEAAGYNIVRSRPGVLPDEADLLRLVPGCVGWIAGVESVSEAVVNAATGLRAISRNGVGTDNLPVALLQKRGVRIASAAGSNANGVAELTLGLILSALRRIPATDAGVKAGGWPRLRGRELRGRTVGIVGCGAIGRRVSELCTAFGARILGFDPAPSSDIPGVAFRWASITQLFGESEIVSLHCPPPASGAPVIGGIELAAMREGAILVNTARSSLVDEAAVCQALDSGRLDGYAADTFANEPPLSLALAGHPRVIATSHIGAFTDESIERATVDAVKNLMIALDDSTAIGG